MSTAKIDRREYDESSGDSVESLRFKYYPNMSRSESAKPGKRPMRSLSVVEKMEAIQRVHKGESKASVARDIGVPESTLRGWCKTEDKIRSMARNSSTPDSEAHSPASSSSTNHISLATIGANHSSEDESPVAKRAKIDQHQHHTGIPSSSYSIRENSENEVSRLSDASKFDYVSLMASMASMRPEHSALLMQQLGMQLGAAATNSLAKSLLTMQPPTSLSHGSTVGLVENGLQYTRNNNNNHNSSNNNINSSGKRQSTSAIAPAQMDYVANSFTRKSLSPAAEAPFSPVPASPYKTNDLYHHQNHNHHPPQQQQQHYNQQRDAHTNNKVKDREITKKANDQLWMWLTQQQALLGQQSVPLNPSKQSGDSWFWQWCKYNLPSVTSTPTSVSTSTSASTTIPQQSIAKKSPSKTRALLDNILCNNNNDNVRRSFNDVGTHEVDGSRIDDNSQVISPEEAIEHGDKFLMWLEKCSEPAVSRLQVMQLKHLLDSLKSCIRNRPTSLIKHSRK